MKEAQVHCKLLILENMTYKLKSQRYRQGYDIYTECDIQLMEALTGCIYPIILPNGKKIHLNILLQT